MNIASASYSDPGIDISAHLIFKPSGKSFAYLFPRDAGSVHIEAIYLDANTNFIALQIDRELLCIHCLFFPEKGNSTTHKGLMRLETVTF